MADEKVEKSLEIIGEAVGLEASDFSDNETWKFLGLGDLLASATASDLQNQVDAKIPSDVFAKYPTVGDLKQFISNGAANGTKNAGPTKAVQPPVDDDQPIPKPKVPLAVALQGRPSSSKTTVFLFPDGSGAGTSYGTLPQIHPSVCLVGLNSPFLRQADHFTCSIERMARVWVEEVRKQQPHGPYILGGWSAGGYYAYEVAKILIAAGEKIDKLILIDSPCRVIYEALPKTVVDELTRKGLMGASGEKKAPEWLVQHFISTVLSVDLYHPTPMERQHVPKTYFIWVKEGLVKSVAESGLNVDLNVKVTRFLLEPRNEFESNGWESLLPGADMKFYTMTGNHFQITQPPHVSFDDRLYSRSSTNHHGCLSPMTLDECFAR